MTNSGLIDVALMLDAFEAVPNPSPPYPRHFLQNVVILDDLLIGQLDWALKETIADACERRGLNWERPTRNFPISYLMYRRNPPHPFYEWDPDHRLWRLMQLSRLIRPTSIGAGYAARLVLEPNGTLAKIIPAGIEGAPSRYWVGRPEQNWIRDEDVEPIRQLIQAFDETSLSNRATRALWFHEYAHQQYYLDSRWALISIGMESLIHTDERGRSKLGSTKQFVDRTHALMDFVGAITTTPDELSEIYERRSTIAHGQQLPDADGEDRELYMKLEDMLRAALRAIILKPEVASVFHSAETVRKSLD